MSNDENREKNEEKAAVPVQPIIDMGSTVVKNSRGTVHCLTIVGQVEGHTLLPDNLKSTKYEHVLPLLAALALFHFFKNLDLGSNRFINGLAGTTLGIYILHQVPVLRDFLWNGIFHAQAHHGSAAYTLLVIVLTFAGCAAIDTLRTRFIMQPLQRSRAFTALCAKGDALAAEIEKQSD